jgi:NAD(P)H-flavin reductase
MQDSMIPTPFRIQRMRRELADTFTMELVPTNSGGAFAARPGQFNMLYVFGVGEVPISISGDMSNGAMVVHTIRSVGTVSGAMAGQRKDDVVGLRGPFGTPWPVKEAEGFDVVIVTGGIGLAPLRPAIYHILANRGRYGKVCIFYGARTPDDILYRRELEKWRGRLDMYVDVTVDRAHTGWGGPVGVVTRLIPRGLFDPLNTVAMVCGPEIMMHFTVQTLGECGMADESIFVSLERNMKCAIGFCGHCQFGANFVCKDGPVFRFDAIRDMFQIREL